MKHHTGGVLEWLLSGLLGSTALLYLYWGLGGSWLKDKSSPIVEGKPLLQLSRTQSLAAALGSLILAAVPVVSMRPVLRESLLCLITIAFTVRAVGDFKYVGSFKKVKDSPFAIWDTRVYAPLALLIAVLAGLQVIRNFPVC